MYHIFFHILTSASAFINRKHVNCIIYRFYQFDNELFALWKFSKIVHFADTN